MCYRLNVCVPPKFRCWNPNLQRWWWYQKVGLWEVNRSWMGVMIKEDLLNSLDSSASWGYKQECMTGRGGSHPDHTGPQFHTSSFQKCEWLISAAYRPTNLWYFVTAAWINKNTMSFNTLKLTMNYLILILILRLVLYFVHFTGKETEK